MNGFCLKQGQGLKALAAHLATPKLSSTLTLDLALGVRLG